MIWKIIRKLIIIGVVLFFGAMIIAGIGAMFWGERWADKPFIGEIVIKNGIYDSKSILDQVEKLRSEELLAGVAVRVESPGGAIGASQEIYQALREFREDSIPVVVSMGNVAASGGLYCSMAGDLIFALPGTVTGSIGVISQFPEATELLEKVGLKFHTVKTGSVKDAGSPFRKVNAEDLKSFDSLLQEMFDQFVNDIALERGLSRDSVLSLADGSLYSGRQGVELGLVDTLGTWHDAVKWIKHQTGVDAETPLRNALPSPGLWQKIWEGPASQIKEFGAILRGGPAWLAPGY